MRIYSFFYDRPTWKRIRIGRYYIELFLMKDGYWIVELITFSHLPRIASHFETLTQAETHAEEIYTEILLTGAYNGR